MTPTSIAPDARHARARCCRLAPQRCPAMLTGFTQRLSKDCPPYANLTNWCATWAPGPGASKSAPKAHKLLLAASLQPASQPTGQPAGRPGSQPATYGGCSSSWLPSCDSMIGQHFRAENFRPKLRPKTPPKDSTSRVKARPKMRSKTFVEKKIGPAQKIKYMVKR